MTTVNYLDAMYPVFGESVRRIALGNFPTPVRQIGIRTAGKSQYVSIKYDNLSANVYGGNKVRKLEYLLAPRTRHRVRRFATFGTVGSNHALATAIYAKQLGFECTCFLAHQAKVETIAPALIMHASLGTEIVRYGGPYRSRLKTLRQNLWDRDAWVVPAGGSSWIGTLGFVNAGLELAAQVDAGEIPPPARIYVATGTMGTAAGLALGLAIAGLRAEVQAVRVSATDICNDEGLIRLIRKTATMMHQLDSSVPPDLANRVRIRIRHSFFAGGYAHSDPSIENAVHLADEQLGLTLESTYTGKAMAALLSDIKQNDSVDECLFWNTYNSVPLTPVDSFDASAIPAEFRCYL
ncbi:MAG: pyridoxal-phosphate dependent enzyme [Gammaproteobacteria bacterium]|nr:pyridoxal-phosphate dependent enzyme [Gammaproteobacteria bacterium]MDH4314605.1 pyridoxal-phosphate dependent enzyme [Gammaproteobacteria bacterium]MDH5214409.1 pyridoxal-phosphate dependent enzyme [Gammaproteobacteria bacterium]MDH5499854.1 pyridoxal-phosphate dependent enzyme [Gammaproteobacteria bacterium]